MSTKRALGSGTSLQSRSLPGRLCDAPQTWRPRRREAGAGGHRHQIRPQEWPGQGPPQEGARGSTVWKNGQGQKSSKSGVGFWSVQNWAEERKGPGLAGTTQVPGPGFLPFAVKSQLKENFHLLMLCFSSFRVRHPPRPPSSTRSLMATGRSMPYFFTNDANMSASEAVHAP